MKRTLQHALNLTLSVFLIAASINSYSQGVTTAAINGTITDDTGSSLPGATIIATHIPSGTVYGTSTTTNGKFQIRNMRIGGPYTIKASWL